MLYAGYQQLLQQKAQCQMLPARCVPLPELLLVSMTVLY
jgi:hypothetical protein